MATVHGAVGMDVESRRRGISWNRVVGILFGVAAQVIFLLTVPYLFRFLRSGGWRPARHWFGIDGILAIQFAVSHSWLLHPTTRRRLRRWMPGELHGCLFCLATCSSLFVVFRYWRVCDGCLWDLSGVSASIMRGAFYAAWIALFYSLWQSGMEYQTGLGPWWDWVRGRPPRKRDLRDTGIFAHLRHPVYLSFLGLIWFTPHMSWDHVLLTVVWTIYIFVGSHLKDERLAHYLGETYRRYQARVPGYPFLPVQERI